MAALPDLELSRLQPDEISLAAGLAARALADNPTSVAVFGSDRQQRIRGLEPAFAIVLASMERPVLSARRRDALVGFAAAADPGRCLFQQSIEHQLTFKVGGRKIVAGSVPRVPLRYILPLARLGLRGLGRMSTMTETHLRHDPQEPHYHVELVAVEPGLQGMGVGGLMMDDLCREMDVQPASGWLETDTEENVRFYRRYGFEVVGEASVLGAQNWYMRRPPK